MKSTLRFLASGLIVASLFLTVAYGQGSQTGGLTGTVMDPQGAFVSGATIDVINEATSSSERRITTDANGNFATTLLPPGTYRLDVTAPNFKQSRITGVQIRVNETARQDVTLELGGVNEVVTVQAVDTIINTTSATMGQPITSQTLEALPLAAPNFLFLLTLSSGTAGEPTDVRTAGRGTADINVNGQRTSNNSLQIDGINVNDFNLAHFDTVPLPNPNVIQEFKVSTSLYDASLGSKGGGSINLVMKSGTKDWHATGYWSHRNDVLNANEWFRNQRGLPRARLLQNVFGFSGSGPIPKAGGFWFFNYQGVRARNGIDPAGSSLSPLLNNFPTNADGTTSATLLANAFGLPVAEIDPTAVRILNQPSTLYGGAFLIPRAGQAGCDTPRRADGSINPTGTFRCNFSGIAPIIDDQYTITYDRSWRGGNDKLTGRWFFDDGSVARPFGTAATLAYASNVDQKNRFLTLSHTHLFNPRVVNELRFGFSRFLSTFAPDDHVSLADVGATRPNSADVPGLYFISVTGLFTVGVGVNDERGTVSNAFNLSDTVSWVKGAHSFRFGGEGARYQLNRYNRFATRGSLTFGGVAGTAFDTAFETFITGRATSLQSAAGDPQRYFRNTDISFFAQDDWKVSQRLTVNLGLRWEGLGFSNEKFHRLGNYDARILQANRNANPFVFPADVSIGGFTGGTPGMGGCVMDKCRDTDNWAPRVSFAYDLFGDQSTVIRGGYGIYYQRLSNQNILQANLSPPFNVQPIENRADGSPGQILANPFPNTSSGGLIAQNLIPQSSRFAGVIGDINTAAGIPIFINQNGERCLNYGGTASNCSINLAAFTAPPLDFESPYTQQWNLMLQRDIGRGFAVEAAYVGSQYVGGLGVYNPFMAPLASPSNPIRVTDINGVTHTITTNTLNNESLRHQLLGLSARRGARFSGGVGRGKYHSAQFTLSRRFHDGLYFQAAYTFSKTRDNVSGSLATDEFNATRAGQTGSNLVNFGTRDPNLNFARGDFDRPHRFVASYNWELPIGRGRRFLGGIGSVADKFLGGWAISGIVTYQNGLPFNITGTGGGAFGGLGATTPVMVCAPLAQQITTLPTCTPGATTTIDQALLTGPMQGRLNNYVNPNFFIQPGNVPNADGTGVTDYGNVPRNAFRAPFQQNWDMSLMKRMTFFERHTLSIRMDVFNVWNHPVFASPSSVSIATRSTFGQITNTAIPARLIQFGVKYDF